MATYNGEKYLRQQLDSILAQTVPFTELIICDDNSSDHTWEILQEYSKNDSRIKIYRNKPNLGFVKNFEKGISLATGDYIALSDQDDIWLPRHLEILLNTIGDADLAVADAKLIDEEGNDLKETLSHATHLDYVPKDDIKKLYFMIFYISQYHGMTMLLTKRLAQKAVPIPEEFEFHDRWLALLACFTEGLNYTYEPVTLYRRLSDSKSGIKTRKPIIKTFLGHFLFKDKVLQEPPLYIEVIENKLKGALSVRQLKFIKTAKNYFRRRKFLIGRLYNILFELMHFKKIYGVKIFH